MIDSRMKIRHLQCFMEVARLGMSAVPLISWR